MTDTTEIQFTCTCPFCNNGTINTAEGDQYTPDSCPQCNGTGEIDRMIDTIRLTDFLDNEISKWNTNAIGLIERVKY